MTRPPRILVVIGTPLADTLNHSLAASYVDAARIAGADVRVIDLASDPIPDHPRTRDELRAPRTEEDVPLDPAVADYVEAVEDADHLVFFFPQWWGTYPAAFKAWVDRVLLSGAVFRYHRTGQGWDKLLKGRTARIVMTMDSPSWWSRFVYRDAGVRALRTATLWYCGIKTVGVTRVPLVRHRGERPLTRAIAAMARLGTADARVTSRASVPAVAERASSR
ncbi:NAD(P)H-dependent oxidoreductase [Demequina muriae]|uniref:NAD(P)H-dependent oxidoreductase n=1 Tax=Demequina muriae TaxID=3051664 RepID=A0ABT8GFM4_9MICO|nr:NAD(P)H-dependent oxidoreductase [Demequina sp. EGI L300058]MDN4480238.1 NAD(P)H-dependent oxidoreductase [Demequina sp. EGI L300058]